MIWNNIFVSIHLLRKIWVIRRHENLLNLKFVLIFVFLWCTEIESGLLLIFVVLTIVKIPIVVFQFDRVHFSWNFIVRLVVTVSRLCRGHLCWSMLLAMFWSHYDPILWSKYSILALFDCSWTFPSDDNPYFDSFSNSLFVCRQL